MKRKTMVVFSDPVAREILIVDDAALKEHGPCDQRTVLKRLPWPNKHGGASVRTLDAIARKENCWKVRVRSTVREGSIGVLQTKEWVTSPSYGMAARVVCGDDLVAAKRRVI